MKRGLFERDEGCPLQLITPSLNVLRDRDRLEEWLGSHDSESIVVAVPAHQTGIDLTDLDYSGLDLTGANFNTSILDGTTFEGSTLNRCFFNSTSLIKAILDGVSVTGCNMAGADLTGAFLRGSIDASGENWAGVILVGAKAPAIILRDAQLTGANFQGAHLRKALFDRAFCENAKWDQADLRRANLSGAYLSGSIWHGTRIDRHTVFTDSKWTNHETSTDGSGKLDLGRVRGWVNWRRLRVIGRLPLFAGSYLLLAGGLATATGIEWVNRGRFAVGLEYVPVPPRLALLLLGSFCLAVGATIFELACPEDVKEFSFAKWVKELQRPGVLYLSEALQRPFWAGLAMPFVLVGGSAITYLFLDRLWAAMSYILGAITV